MLACQGLHCLELAASKCVIDEQLPMEQVRLSLNSAAVSLVLLFIYFFHFISFRLLFFPASFFTSIQSVLLSALPLFLYPHVYSPSAAQYLSKSPAIKPLPSPRPLTVSPAPVQKLVYTPNIQTI